MKKIVFLILFAVPLLVMADEDVTAFYKKVILDKTGVVFTSSGSAEEVDEILVQTDEIKDGVYEVEVTRIDGHIYRIDGTSYFIKMPYCYEYSYSDEAILKVKTYAGYKTGTSIWIKD